MDENRQHTTDNKLAATEDVRWVFNENSKLLLPKQASRRKKSVGKTLRDWMLLFIQKLRALFKGKAPWDWLQLLFVPLLLAALGFWFTTNQNRLSLQTSNDQHKIDMHIAQDGQRETTLRTYMDSLSDLLLSHLQRTNLHGSNLHGASLSRATNVNSADIRSADMSETYLYGTIISKEQLSKAKSLKDAIMPDGSVSGSSSSKGTALTAVDWANFTYVSSCYSKTRSFTTRNGIATTEGISLQTYRPVFGDLTGDGQPEAVIRYACSGADFGGIRAFVYTGTKAHPILLGDLPFSMQGIRDANWIVEQVGISDGIVQLKGKTYSPLAARCCPDLQFELSYRWDGNHFAMTHFATTSLISK